MNQDPVRQICNEFAGLPLARALPTHGGVSEVEFRKEALPRLRTVLLQLLKVSILLVFPPFAALAADLTPPAFDQAAHERCLQSPERAHERRRPHAETLLRTYQDSPARDVPAQVPQLFERIVKAAGSTLKVKPRLAGYANKNRTAFVTANGVVFLSDTAWRGSAPWADDEVAAVFAHEIAHLVQEDSARRICEFAAMMAFSPNDPIAVEAELHSRVGGGDRDLGIEMFRRNHAREYAADALGLELLVKAGFPAEAMARMLFKLMHLGAGPSGTHPDPFDRVQNAHRLAAARSTAQNPR